MFHSAEKAERKEVIQIEEYNFGEDAGIKRFTEWCQAFSFNMLHLMEGPMHGLSESQMKKLTENIIGLAKEGPKNIEEVPVHEYFKRLQEDLKPYMDKKVELMPDKKKLDDWLALAELSLVGMDLIKIARQLMGTEADFVKKLKEADPEFTQLDEVFSHMFKHIKDFCATLLSHDYDVKKVKNPAEAVQKEIERLFPTDGTLFPYE